MRRLLALPPGRAVVLAAAAMFAVYFVVAFTFRRLGVGIDALSVVAGVFAYAYLGLAALIGIRAWRTRPTGGARAVRRYLSAQPAVEDWVGAPVEVEVPPLTDDARHGGQANVTATVRGPRGTATADLVLARLGREWEVLQAELVRDGERVRLTTARP
jgi:hypothetical protein